MKIGVCEAGTVEGLAGWRCAEITEVKVAVKCIMNSRAKLVWLERAVLW